VVLYLLQRSERSPVARTAAQQHAASWNEYSRRFHRLSRYKGKANYKQWLGAVRQQILK